MMLDLTTRYTPRPAGETGVLGPRQSTQEQPARPIEEALAGRQRRPRLACTWLPVCGEDGRVRMEMTWTPSLDADR